VWVLQGDPTYLVVESDKTLATYGINAVCTHLGCVVPWNAAENKFLCPCHGSQYNNQGKVVRGPAPLVRKQTLPSQLNLSEESIVCLLNRTKLT
jgi:Rieske Fe-S protein